MNEYDSERIQDMLRPLGYEAVDSPENANLVVLNTCHIREKATEKVYSELGRLKKLKTSAKDPMTIAVAGCVAQAEGGEIMRRQPAVDLVLGPQSYHKLPEMIARVSRAIGDRLETDFDTLEKFDALPKTRNASGASAFLSVQEGCDKFCTFCVVPYTRGAENSRTVDSIVFEARSLAAQGVREITLLGQNVNAYHGTELGKTEEWNLGRLIRHLSRIGGIDRIRYSTSHPRDMDDDLIAAHGDCYSMMPYLHLPVQSGSNRILKAMNRGHTRERYFEIIQKVRSARSDTAIASDFIVGFPGETDADFEDTMNLVRKIEYAIAYSFKYSARPGTPAAELPRQIPRPVQDERLQRLQELLRDQQTKFNASKIGQILPVLVTGRGRQAGQVHGRTPYQQAVHFDAPESLIGKIVDIKIEAASLNALAGNLEVRREKAA